MRFALLTAFAVLLCTAPKCYANDSTSFVNRISGFPNKFFNRVNHTTASLDNQLTTQTTKYLQKLARREERLKKKLLQSDSNAAKTLFTDDISRKYALLSQGLSSDSSRIVSSMGPEYLPYADSLQSSLAFLKNNPALVSSSKLLPADIQRSLDQVRQLQAKMQDADQIKQFIQQRKQQLTQYFAQYTHLPPGVSGMLSDYKHQMYYYSEQVRNLLDVTFGSITPEQYAEKQIALESNSTFSQFKVAKELGIKSFGKKADPTSNRQLKQYEKGKISDKELKTDLKSDLRNYYNPQTHENAFDLYKKNGQDMRNLFLKSQKNDNDSSPKEKNNSSPCLCVTPPWVIFNSNNN